MPSLFKPTVSKLFVLLFSISFDVHANSSYLPDDSREARAVRKSEEGRG